MSETEVNLNSEDGIETEFIEMQECDPTRSEAIQINTEMNEYEYSSRAHSDEDLHRSETSTETFTTDTSDDDYEDDYDYEEEDEEEDKDKDKDKDDEEDFRWKTRSKNIRHVRMGCKKYAQEISNHLRVWNMAQPEVIFSVLSDSDFDSDTCKKHEAVETNPKESASDIKKTFCRDLVDAVAKTNAWIITGGLNKGVDQLIGNEVKQRLANWEQIPKAVIGITNLDCLAEKDLPGPNCDETGLSLNQNHTHFLLVDYGTQRKSGCEDIPREIIELDLTKSETKCNDHKEDSRLIYVLVGGRMNAFRIVERALTKQLPVIIAMGTGGAADIISCKDGATLEYMPEITDKLFRRLEELLIAGRTSSTLVRQALTNIKAQSKLEILFAIVELLGQTRISDGGPHQFKDEIATLVKTTTSVLLAGIKDLLTPKQTPSDRSSYSATSTEFETVSRMRAVFEQMLVVNEIPPEKAKRAVNDLEHEVINETLTKVKLLQTDLKAMRTPDRKGLLIKFDITRKGKKTISFSIVEALKKACGNKRSDLYMLVANWDNETFFRQLLRDNSMRGDHETVFEELLKSKDKTKYIKLMMEHVSNRKWLTKLEGPLEEDFEKNKLCASLLKKVRDTEGKAGLEDESCRMKGKILFIWCVLQQMRETAMLFWEQGQDCLAMALVAYGESKKLKENLLNKKGYDEMEQQMQFFAKLALDFTSKCYADNGDSLYYLLFYDVADLDGISSYDIAIKANFEAFFCVDAMQDMVNRVWTANIEDHWKGKYVPMILSEVCPLLAPALLQISDDDDEEEDDITCQKGEPVCKYFKNVGTFINTPLVKFTYRFISYIVYLTLFSVVMLTDFRAKISPSEIALTIWTFILIMEEVIQVIDDISAYKSNGWNYFDIGALLLYIIGFIPRMIYHSDPTICPDCLYVARIVLAFSLIVFFFRALQYLSIFDATGPTIYMIRQLVADLVSILLILAVFISAYGVASNVILYPNQPLNSQLLVDVFYDAWWSVIQQFNREDALGSNCNKNNVSAIFTAEYCSSTSDDNIDYVRCKENRCPANNWIVSILLAFYALLTCIMLLNVLIAMFNATFSTVNSKQRDVSKLQKYRIMQEYFSGSVVPPPLCVITYPYHIINYFYDRCNNCLSARQLSDLERGQHGEESRASNSPPKDNEPRKSRPKPWQEWELGIAADFYRQNKDKDGWPMTRIKSVTSYKFDKKTWFRNVTQFIKTKSGEETEAKDNEEIEEEESKEIDDRVNEETRANRESTEATGKKGN